MEALNLNLDEWNSAELVLPIEQNLSDDDILNIADPSRLTPGCGTHDQDEALEDDDSLSIIEQQPTSSKLTISEELSFWREAAARMERSPAGTRDGLLHILGMIKRLEFMRHKNKHKQSKITCYLTNKPNNM